MKWLSCGAIVPSHNPWASPILCVAKKSGEVRLSCDYRLWNRVTKVPSVPIPRTRELLQRMAGYKYYSAFDLSNGYHNLVLRKDAQPTTAIILPDELGLPSRSFEYTRLPFGLAAAPGIL